MKWLKGIGLALIPFHLHDYPIALTLGCYLLSCAVIFYTDRFALPARERRKNAPKYGRNRDRIDHLARLPVIALVFAGFFAISWRPLCRRRHDEFLHHFHRHFPREVQVHP